MSQAAFSVGAGATVWFTGLSGAGKSTLSVALKAKLDELIGDSKKVFILDGDVIRAGLNKNLGFSAEDRAENIRRISEVSKLMALAGQICLVAFISPYSKDRGIAKEVHTAAGVGFHECHIAASLECCEQRDVKGLYAKARAGVIKNFTGVSDPYEAPENPDLRVETGEKSLDECAKQVMDMLVAKGCLIDHTAPRVVPTLVTPMTIDEKAEFEGLDVLDVDIEQAEYLQTIGEGWAYPLKRFMNEMELLEVMNMKTMTVDGERHLLSVPITQAVSTAEKEKLSGKAKIAIKCTKISGDILAVIEEPEFFENRKEEISARCFGTQSTKHPKVERIMAQGDFLVSGKSMKFVKHVEFNDGMDQYRLTPFQIQEKIKEKKADAVYAFQVRNPLHNGHVLLLKDTREQLLKKGFKNPILLLHPLGGWCKDDDVPLNFRMRQHQALLDDGTLNPEHTILAVWPSPMYYGGPGEVLWHASSRVNAGISHFITGRDPAGVKHPEIKDKDLYDVWHGQKLLVHCKSMLNNVDVVPFKVAAYNTKNKAMEFFGGPGCIKEDFEFISGSRMRKMAADGSPLPEGFMSPKAWDVLCEYYKSLA